MPMPADHHIAIPDGRRPPDAALRGVSAVARPMALVLVLAAVLAFGCTPKGNEAGQSLTAHVVSRSQGGPSGPPSDCFDLGRMDDPDHLFKSSCPPRRSLTVKAKAYVSRRKGKKSGYPRGAWGDTLTPDVRAIAVSPDLVDAGLGYKTRLTIEGLPGEYVVLDLMHGRWRKTIDVYFGDDRNAARQWGNRTITISFE